MIKFDILKRFSSEVAFTAEIDCAEDAPRSLKVGLSVKWGVENNADLSDADLSDADLSDANLSDANLSDANLWNANLWNANLWNANLRNADLSDANLWNADLRNADLSDADLRNANLRNADLSDANLWNAHGLNTYVKCIQIETYSITYTSEVMQIGCERHSLTDWKDFDDSRIAQMDGKSALKFWRKYKGWIFQTIEICPAQPTKAEVPS